ncbi:MAG: hypothetical protein PHE27_05390 [Alphaproteobacteria bacterium]|nr:hypothetical protein [Alphaproteobacteria bacterium]
MDEEKEEKALTAGDTPVGEYVLERALAVIFPGILYWDKATKRAKRNKEYREDPPTSDDNVVVSFVQMTALMSAIGVVCALFLAHGVANQPVGTMGSEAVLALKGAVAAPYGVYNGLGFAAGAALDARHGCKIISRRIIEPIIHEISHVANDILLPEAQKGTNALKKIADTPLNRLNPQTWGQQNLLPEGSETQSLEPKKPPMTIGNAASKTFEWTVFPLVICGTDACDRAEKRGDAQPTPTSSSENATSACVQYLLVMGAIGAAGALGAAHLVCSQPLVSMGAEMILAAKGAVAMPVALLNGIGGAMWIYYDGKYAAKRTYKAAKAGFKEASRPVCAVGRSIKKVANIPVKKFNPKNWGPKF